MSFARKLANAGLFGLPAALLTGNGKNKDKPIKSVSLVTEGSQPSSSSLIGNSRTY